MASRNSPYIPQKAIFHESISRPELFNEHNNRLERVVSDIKDIIRDAVDTKNIVLGSVQKLEMQTDKSTLIIYDKLKSIENNILVINKKQDQFNNFIEHILISLSEIKERLTEYEVEPEYEIDANANADGNYVEVNSDDACDVDVEVNSDDACAVDAEANSDNENYANADDENAN